MSAEQIVEYCLWYLDHLYLFLIPAAVFDIVCWIAIAIYVMKRRASRPNAPPLVPAATMTTNSARR